MGVFGSGWYLDLAWPDSYFEDDDDFLDFDNESGWELRMETTRGGIKAARVNWPTSEANSQHIGGNCNMKVIVETNDRLSQ